MRRKWHPDEIEILRKLYPRPDVPIEEICRGLNRSYRSVINKVYELGLHRDYTPHINMNVLKQWLKVREI